jgi:hypothetical protein
MFGLFNRKKQNTGNSESGNNPYHGLRKMAFDIKPESLGVTLDNDEQVYGAIIDMGMNSNNVCTMVCFIDGTASLYFSTGGGFIGAGEHEDVRKAAGSFLVSIHQVLPVMRKTDCFDIVPIENHHIFYLLTRAGVYTIDIDLDDYSKSKETYFLFSLAQMVLSEIRKVQENK